MSSRAAVTCLFGFASLAPACATDVCGQRCGAAGECPSGFVCAGEGYCVPQDDRAACGELAGVSPLSPTQDPTGKTAGPGAGSGGGGAGPGDAGAADAARLPLAIEVLAPSDSCASDAIDIELRASGGDAASYRWRVDGAAGAFAPREGSGSVWVLSGAPAAAGRVELHVELSDGATTIQRSIALLVHDRPRIVSDGWPALCPGEVASLALAAEGGDAGSYEFSASADPALGLSFDGSRLVGRFSPGAASPSVVLSVRDRHCASSPRELSLDVLPAGSEACPQIQVSAAGATLDQLPPPCLGSDYEQAFVAGPADAPEHPVSWREVATAPGLHFDPSERVLRGTALAAGVITLQVTGEGGRTIEADFPVAPRERCWLGYLAQGDGARRLQLFDPRLSEQPASRRAYPGAAADGDVLDFAFSPRGRFLAYRVAPEGEPIALRLLDLRSWREQAPAFEGSVDAYAWSRSGATGEALAVAFEAGGERQLGGLVLSPAASQPDASRAVALDPDAPYELAVFEPAPVEVRSELTWFDADRVGFLAADPAFEPGRLFQCARFDAGTVSLDPPRERLEFFDGARLLPAPSGLFVVDTSTTRLHFFATDGDEADHRAGMLVAPSGAFTARATGGVLQVFRAADPSVADSEPVWAQADGCTSILAWARGRERIACAVAGDGTQRVAFFDLPDPDRPELVRLARVQGDYRFLSGQHVGRPRVFAEGGRRFAFSTDDDIYVVRLDDGTPRVEVAASMALVASAPASVELSFSANARFFAVHAGDGLGVWNFDTEGDRFGRVSRVLAEPVACSEGPFDAAPWCGAAASDASIRWSADEDAFAFRTRAGGLEVEDLSLGYPSVTREISADPSCSGDCVVPGSYAFQP